MAFEAIVAIIGLILGVVLLVFSSDKAVEHSVSLASALRISPLMIGLVLASIGTDLPEIANSIASSVVGHGDINVGGSLGSVLAQMSLVLRLVPFLGGMFKVKRKGRQEGGSVIYPSIPTFLYNAWHPPLTLFLGRQGTMIPGFRPSVVALQHP